MIYLDNAATTQIRKEVLNAMNPYLTKYYGNAGGNYSLGQVSKRALGVARSQVANMIGANPDQIVFTSGGSEGNNMVFSPGMRNELIKKGKTHIIISAGEHDSVFRAALAMIGAEHNDESDLIGCGTYSTSEATTESKGKIKEQFYLYIAPLLPSGVVDYQWVRDKVKNDDKLGLVSIMHTNNETGAINPVSEIGKLCHENSVIFHTDCVQAIGAELIDVRSIECDYLTASGHKFHAPKGTGFIYVRKPDKAYPLIYGGQYQENGLRGGTENIAGIVGLGKACELVTKNLVDDMVSIRALKKTFYETLMKSLKIQGLDKIVKINGSNVSSQSKSLNLRFESIDGETLVILADAKGLCISAGSACHAATSNPSRVLIAMGLEPDQARDSVRISFSSLNSLDEVKEAGIILAQCVYTLANYKEEIYAEKAQS